MCGINGIMGGGAGRDERVRTMCATTAHRGPDGTGDWADEHVALGHNRLAVLDLSDAAAQPMHSADGRYTLVYNGELYNFRELRAELQGYPFRTSGDSEVLLAAWERWGRECLPRLNGMFAFALWDARDRELFLVRDPAGIKPLYWRQDGAELSFSSELKALVGNAPALDAASFNTYLRLLYVPGPRTMILGVQSLPPGHLLSCKNSAVRLEAYEPRTTAAVPAASAAGRAAQLWESLDAAVNRQLVSDRPVGIYLSGGLDSNAVLASVAGHGARLKTFSVGFALEDREESEKFNADLALARRSAEHFGVEHHTVLFDPREVPAYLEESVYYLDQPNWNPTALPMLKLARFAAPQITVALTGDGGDELLGGYERYQKSRLLTLARRVPFANLIAGLSPHLAPLGTDEGVERFVQFMFQKEESVGPVLDPAHNDPQAALAAVAPLFSGEGEFESQFMEADRLGWLADEALVRTDRMNMAAGLEARVPFLDLEFSAFARRLPLRDKVTARHRKILLRRALKGRVPDFVLNEPKRGWFSPAAKWLRRPEVLAFAREILSPSFYAPTAPLFNWKTIEARLEGHQEKGGYHLHTIWPLMVFQLWAKRFGVRL